MLHVYKTALPFCLVMIAALFATTANAGFGDPADVDIAVNPAAISENAGVSTVTITCSFCTEGATVTLGYDGSTATNNVDYSGQTTTVTFPASFATQNSTFDITAITDSFVEGDETVVITITDIDTGFQDNFGTGRNRTITISDVPPLDFGDAPAPYPTELADDGARHILASGGPILGVTVDSETDGQPDSMAINGDGNDEDGVRASSLFVPGQTATVTVEVTGAAGFLDVWIDFDIDGSWNEAGDKVMFTNLTTMSAPGSGDVQLGLNELEFNVPAGLTENTLTFARLRVTSLSGGTPAFTGQQTDGEVEDYPLFFAPAAPSGIQGIVIRDGNIFIVDDDDNESFFRRGAVMPTEFWVLLSLLCLVLGRKLWLLGRQGKH